MFCKFPIQIDNKRRIYICTKPLFSSGPSIFWSLMVISLLRVIRFQWLSAGGDKHTNFQWYNTILEILLFSELNTTSYKVMSKKKVWANEAESKSPYCLFLEMLKVKFLKNLYILYYFYFLTKKEDIFVGLLPIFLDCVNCVVLL